MSDWSKLWIECSFNDSLSNHRISSSTTITRKCSIPKSSRSLRTNSGKRSSSNDTLFKKDISLSKDNSIELEPKSVKNLAVSKQKLKELKNWLTGYFDTSQSNILKSPFLLLNGPSGSGKTITLRLLCNELKIKFIELPTTSINNESNFLTDSLHQMSIEYKSIKQKISIDSILENQIDSVTPLQDKSQMNRFRRFLYDLNYYKKSIFDVDEDQKKVLVIEDIPNIFFTKPYLLHEELKQLLKKFKSNIIPIVFIISTIINVDIEQKILPKMVQKDLNIQVITFKPISDYCLTKTLENSSIGKKLNKCQIEEIVQVSSGDIRHAINYLQFKYSSDSNFRKSGTKKAKYISKNFEKVSFKNDICCDRNDPLTLSHSLGKILYAKRLDTTDINILNFIKNYPNCDKSKLRNPLKENYPETIVDRANQSCDNIIDWIYENYLDFIPEDDLDRCADCLQVLSDSVSNFIDYNEKEEIEKIRISFLTRGIMFNLNRDQSSYKNLGEMNDNSEEKKINNKFRPLRPPKIFLLNKEIITNQFKINELKKIDFLMFRNQTSLVLDILPSVHFLPRNFLQESGLINSIDFIKYLVNFESTSNKLVSDHTNMINDKFTCPPEINTDDFS